MKPLQFLIVLTLATSLISCGHGPKVTVNAPGGENIIIEPSLRMGGRGAVVAKAGGATVVVQENYDDSFREGSKTARFGIGAALAASAVGNAADALTATTASNNAVKIAAGQQATAQAKIAADLAAEQARLAAEAGAGGAVTPGL